MTGCLLGYLMKMASAGASASGKRWQQNVSKLNLDALARPPNCKDRDAYLERVIKFSTSRVVIIGVLGR